MKTALLMSYLNFKEKHDDEREKKRLQSKKQVDSVGYIYFNLTSYGGMFCLKGSDLIESRRLQFSSSKKMISDFRL